MKRFLLVILLSLGAYNGFSNSLISLWGGAGLATKYNYDMGVTGGFDFAHAVINRFGIGISAFTQQYNLYYDKELNEFSGASIRHKSMYLFACPKLEYHIGRKGNTHFYLSGGAGFKMGVEDTMHKWAKTSYIPGSGYDSLVDRSASVNSMVYRVGFGFTEFFSIKGHLSFTFTEDFGFLPSLISKSDEPNNATLHSNVNQFYRPTYFTLHIGICYNTRR
jgi:hypothetical protein